MANHPCLILLLLAASAAAAEPAGRGVHRETTLEGVTPLMLARTGKALAEIVVPPPATPVARFAAQELKTYLDAVTGADFPMRSERSGTMPALVVGGGAWLPGWDIDTTTMPRDGFAIRRFDDVLVVAGRDDPTADPRVALAGGQWGTYFERGTLFGVYHLLERIAGVRFYFPGELGTVVPHRPDLDAPAVSIDEAPDCPIREMSWYEQPWFGGADAAAVRMAHNLQRLRLRGSTLHVPNCHGLARLGLAERFAASHPEYFAKLANGQRDTDLSLPGHHGHLCFSSPGLAEEIYRDARAFLLGQPATARGARCRFGETWDQSAFRPGFFNIMPQDGHGPANFCRCPACAARYDGGQASDVVWGFVCGIATRLQHEGVPGSVTAMAYGSCLQVPATEMPGNVRVMVALSGPWSMRDPSLLALEEGLVDGWLAKLGGRRIWLWNYLNNYAGQIPTGIPAPCPRAIAAYYRRLGGRIDGAFLESEVDAFLPCQLNWTVAMRTLWNLETDVEELLAEHHRLMYGAGAAAMVRLHDALERRWLERGLGATSLRPDGFVITPPTDAELWQDAYGQEFQDGLEAMAQEALAATTDDPASRQRIALVREEVLGPMRTARSRQLERERDVASLAATVPRAEGEIAIDGALDEAAWSRASRMGMVPLRGAASVVRTAILALWRPDALLLGFDCEEPRATEMAVTARPHDDRLIWQDSSLEVFLDPSAARTGYMQLLLNPAGSTADVRFTAPGTAGDWAWESGLVAAVRRTDGRWTAELAIPASALGGPLSSGRELVANLCRSRVLAGAGPQDNQLLTWSPYLTLGFHDPIRFGRLVLAEAPEVPLLRNGGFDATGDDLAGWHQTGEAGRIASDGVVFRDGCAALRLRGGPVPVQVAQQVDGLEPGRSYRLHFVARAEQAVGDGLRVLVLGQSVLALTVPPFTGSFDWSARALDFTAPADGSPSVVRIAGDHAAGTVWIDALHLEPLPQ